MCQANIGDRYCCDSGILERMHSSRHLDCWCHNNLACVGGASPIHSIELLIHPDIPSALISWPPGASRLFWLPLISCSGSGSAHFHCAILCLVGAESCQTVPTFTHDLLDFLILPECLGVPPLPNDRSSEQQLARRIIFNLLMISFCALSYASSTLWSRMASDSTVPNHRESILSRAMQYSFCISLFARGRVVLAGYFKQDPIELAAFVHGRFKACNEEQEVWDLLIDGRLVIVDCRIYLQLVAQL